jgi:hypothetical protein
MPSAKPLGFYGLDFEAEIEIAIDGLHLPQLTDLLDDMASSLNNTHYIDNDEVPEILDMDKPITSDDLSDAEKISLIRGLCDRIENELMEASK